MLDNAIPQGFEDAVELRRKNRETVVKYMNNGQAKSPRQGREADGPGECQGGHAERGGNRIAPGRDPEAPVRPQRIGHALLVVGEQDVAAGGEVGLFHQLLQVLHRFAAEADEIAVALQVITNRRARSSGSVVST